MSITIEIDDHVRGSLGGATDWNSMLLRRQLTGALFREQTDGFPQPGLLTVVDIPDDVTIVAAVSEDARCQSGKPPSVRHIAQALHEASKQRLELFLFHLLSHIQTQGNYLEIKSRVPKLNIARLLSSPQFGIQGADSESTSSFRAIQAESNAALCLKRINPSGSYDSGLLEDIDVVVSKSPEHALTLFREGAIDMTCPTSLAQSIWRESIKGNPIKHLRINPKLLIGVSLLIPHNLRVAYDLLNNGIDRTLVAHSVYNCIYPAWNWSNIWYSSPPDDLSFGRFESNQVVRNGETHPSFSAAGIKELTIEYADFTPNQQIAAEIARQLSALTAYPVAIREVDYSALLSSPRDSKAIRLVLRYFPWSHPAAMLYPSLSDPESKHLLGMDYPEPESLFAAYSRQQRLQGEIVVGGLRSAVLTTLNTFELPPTGWLDFADLSRGQGESFTHEYS